MKAAEKDAEALAGLVKIVWPEHTEEALTEIILEYMNSEESAVFAEKRDGRFIGAALCSLRHDYVEGCETSPVGYLEGVSVKETYRNQGIARRLVEECEQWAREKGCREFASDCELSNTASLNFHLQIGFQEQNRIICFKKEL
ncbi:MAG: GNAT family N-acetyltransferase [Lachnospiraceae bacterium]|nr:GNAT family N-acetyltransferase [Lachnospiraceae bacterium]